MRFPDALNPYYYDALDSYSMPSSMNNFIDFVLLGFWLLDFVLLGFWLLDFVLLGFWLFHASFFHQSGFFYCICAAVVFIGL